MKLIRGFWFYAATLAATATLGFAEQTTPYSGAASQLELPEISALVDIQGLTTDIDGNPNDAKIRIKEVELGFQGYVRPSIRGDLIIALEQEYLEDSTVETLIDVEEAYISFLNLPAGLQALVGRKLLGFGRLNGVHPHHWVFSDSPLPLSNIFGHHPWLDDGAEISCLVPNPVDIYLKVNAGVWNGKSLGDAHAHEDEHGHGEVMEWDSQVYTGRVFADLPFTNRFSTQLGYSIATQEGYGKTLQGTDIVFRYQWANTYRRVKWHSEGFLSDDEKGTSPFGAFSMLQITLDKYWEIGGRYDWTELLADDEERAWSGSWFVTHSLTHTTYIRGQYQFRKHADGDSENIFMAQLVWGIGPHSHRLSD